MPRELDFFFYIGSTYTYLSVNRVEEIAARAGLSLRWRPFNVRAIMIEQNNRPFIGKPVKLRYMWRDLERRANRYGIPFKSPPDYPVDPEGLANRVALIASCGVRRFSGATTALRTRSNGPRPTGAKRMVPNQLDIRRGARSSRVITFSRGSLC